MKKIIFLISIFIFYFGAAVPAARAKVIFTKAIWYHKTFIANIVENSGTSHIRNFNSVKQAAAAFAKHENMFGHYRYTVYFMPPMSVHVFVTLKFNHIKLFYRRMKLIERLMASRKTIDGFKNTRDKWCSKFYADKICPNYNDGFMIGSFQLKLHNSNRNSFLRVIERYYREGR